MVDKKVHIKILFDGKQFTDGISKAKLNLKAFRDVGKSMAIAGVAMGAALGGVVKIAGDFEKSMSRVKALSGANVTEFKSLSQAARDLGKSTVFSAAEAAEGMSYLAMAGYNTSEIIAAMPGLLDGAAAGQLELGRTADITSNILSGFGIEASETNKVMDVLTAAFTSSNTTLEELGDTMKFVAPVAKSAGVSLEQTAAAAGIMANSGVKAGMAGRQLKNILVRLIDPPKDAADAIEQLGLSIVDKTGAMKPLANIIDQVNLAMEGMGKTEKAALAGSLAGREAMSGFIALLGAGGPAIAKYTKELENSAGIAKKIAAIQTDNLAGSFTKLKSALMEAAISIGTALIPVVKMLVDKIKILVDWFNNLSEPTKTMIATIAALATVFALIIGPLLFIIGSIPVIIAGIGAVTAVVGSIIAVASGIGPLLWIIIAAGTALIANWGKIKATAIAVWEKGIAQSIHDILAKFPEWIKGIWESTYKMGEALIEGFWKGIDSMTSWFKNNFNDWVDGVIQEFKKQFKIKSPSQVMADIGIALVQGLWEGIKNMHEWIKSKFKNFTNQVITNFKEGFGIVAQGPAKFMLDIGTNLIKGLWIGISNAFSDLQTNIKNFGNGVIQEFKNIFGIKSPSTVMESLGSYLIDGLVIGIEKNIHKVKQPFEDIQKDITKTIQDTVIGFPKEGLTIEDLRPPIPSETLGEPEILIEDNLQRIPDILRHDIKDAMKDAINDILSGNKTIGESFKDLSKRIQKSWEDVSKVIIEEHLDKLLDSFTDLLKDTPFEELAEKLKDPMKDAVLDVLKGNKTLKDSFRDLTQSVKSMFFDMIQSMLIEWAKTKILQSMGGGNGGGIIKGVSGILSAFGGFFADGGSPPLGKASIVGERGPEFFIPKQSGTIVPNGAVGGQSNPTYVYAPNIQTSASKEEVFGILDKHSKEFFNRVQTGIQNNHGLRSVIKSI